MCAVAEYCEDHVTAVEVDTTGFATIDQIDIDVVSLEDWPAHAAEILAAGFTGLCVPGDMSPFGTLHDSWLICDPTVARIVETAN